MCCLVARYTQCGPACIVLACSRLFRAIVQAVDEKRDELVNDLADLHIQRLTRSDLQVRRCAHVNLNTIARVSSCDARLVSKWCRDIHAKAAPSTCTPCFPFLQMYSSCSFLPSEFLTDEEWHCVCTSISSWMAAAAVQLLAGSRDAATG